MMTSILAFSRLAAISAALAAEPDLCGQRLAEVELYINTLRAEGEFLKPGTVVATQLAPSAVPREVQIRLLPTAAIVGQQTFPLSAPPKRSELDAVSRKLKELDQKMADLQLMAGIDVPNSRAYALLVSPSTPVSALGRVIGALDSKAKPLTQLDFVVGAVSRLEAPKAPMPIDGVDVQTDPLGFAERAFPNCPGLQAAARASRAVNPVDRMDTLDIWLNAWSEQPRSCRCDADLLAMKAVTWNLQGRPDGVATTWLEIPVGAKSPLKAWLKAHQKDSYERAWRDLAEAARK